MNLLFTALIVMVAAGLGSLLLARRFFASQLVGAAGVVAGCLLAAPVIWRALTGPVLEFTHAWEVPGGAFSVGVDPLSAFFLAVICLVSPLAAMYGVGYLAHYRGRRRVGASWFFLNVLVASMMLVVVARNAVLFLVAWEGMSLAAYALVTFDDQDARARHAGWAYLLAAQVGVAALMLLFLAAGRYAGSMDFGSYGTLASLPPRTLTVMFLLALVGFGTKAGVMPLHVWLPEAHPAAPSHVSALMSGVMIKMGVYGLVRTLSLLGPPPAAWAWLLIGLGAMSGLVGLVFSLAQHDLKRALAYSSIENVGMILLGLGLGLLGLHERAPAVALLGIGGALLHTLNHSLFKPLLFLGAGAVAHATGTRDLNALGGLWKGMRWTGALFVLGATAISALPPLNGFAGEFVVFLGALRGATSLSTSSATAAVVLAAVLAAIAGLAAAGFTRLAGGIFLGAPRNEAAARAREAGWTMRLPMLALGIACVMAAAGAPGLARLCLGVAQTTFDTATAGDLSACDLAPLTAPLVPVLIAGLFLVASIAALLVLRAVLLRRRAVRATVTWDCGYAAPAPRMQYTPSSFAEPLTSFFRGLLRSRRPCERPGGLFPRSARYATATPDLLQRDVVRAQVHRVSWALARVRWLQQGHLHLYVLYIVLMVLTLVIWALGGQG